MSNRARRFAVLALLGGKGIHAQPIQVAQGMPLLSIAWI